MRGGRRPGRLRLFGRRAAPRPSPARLQRPRAAIPAGKGGRARCCAGNVTSGIGKTNGVGSAPVESRRDARDERGVIGEPPIHVSDPLDSEPAPRQGRFQHGQPGIRCLRQSRRLLPYQDIVSDPASHDAADAGEPEVDLAGHVSGDSRPGYCREDYGRLPSQVMSSHGPVICEVDIHAYTEVKAVTTQL